MGDGFRFGVVSTAAIRDPNVTAAQLRVLAEIATFADKDGWCVVRQQVVGDHLGISQQAVGKHVKALVALGHLLTEARYGDDGSRRASRYCVRLDPPTTSEVVTPTTPEVAGPTTPEVVASRTDLVNRPSEQTTTAAEKSAAPKTRKRDILFESVAAACGIRWQDGLTDTAAGPLRKAVKSIRPVWDGTPTQVHRKAREYHVRMPDCELTPTALAKWWPQLNGDPRHVPGSTGSTLRAAQALMEERQ